MARSPLPVALLALVALAPLLALLGLSAAAQPVAPSAPQSPAQSQIQPPALPPEEPTVAFSAEYRLEHNSGGRRVAVSGPLLRDELLDGDLDAATVLVDQSANPGADRAHGRVLLFLPDDPEHRLRRGSVQSLPALALGYRSVVGALGAPRQAGQRQIAGQNCTQLLWNTPAEQQEWCVTAQGIALSARRHAGSQETRTEVLVLELQPPNPALFALPPGFTLPDE